MGRRPEASPLIKISALQESSASPLIRLFISGILMLLWLLLLLCGRGAIWLQRLRSVDALQLLAVLRLIYLPWQPFRCSIGDPGRELLFHSLFLLLRRRVFNSRSQKVFVTLCRSHIHIPLADVFHPLAPSFQTNAAAVALRERLIFKIEMMPD